MATMSQAVNWSQVPECFTQILVTNLPCAEAGVQGAIELKLFSGITSKHFDHRYQYNWGVQYFGKNVVFKVVIASKETCLQAPM